MLKSLSIKNFRNFADFELTDFTRINLIVGKNDTGKSNLLDAISVYAAGADLHWIIELLKRRELVWTDVKDVYSCMFLNAGEKVLASFFTNWNDSDSDDNEICIAVSDHQCREDNISMRQIRLVRQSAPKGDDLGIKILKADEQHVLPIVRGFQAKSPKIGNKMIIFDGSHEFKILPEKRGNVPFRYVFTQRMYKNISEDLQLWGQIAISPMKQHLFDALKIIDRRIVDFVFKPSENVPTLLLPYVRFEQSDEPVPLTTLGEGVSRIVTVMLNLLTTPSGVLLIDEIENGLHYSVQVQLWRLLFSLSEKLNVQIFTTTHSEDCVQAFNEVLNEQSDRDVGQLIKLVRKNGKTLHAVYKAENLNSALVKEMEVR